MKEKKQQKSKKKKGWDPLSLTVLLIALCVFVFSELQKKRRFREENLLLSHQKGRWLRQALPQAERDDRRRVPFHFLCTIIGKSLKDC